MILLTKSGNTLAPARRIPLQSMSLDLKERESTATIVPEDATGISIGSLMRDDTRPGLNIVWRVKSIRQSYDQQTVTVQLEHAIAMLRDRILFGEAKAPEITGKKNATTCTAKEAVQFILKQQSDWVLGTFSYATVSNPYRFDGDSLFDCLETVTNSLEDARWTYDTTVYPFKLNIIKLNDDVDSILRPNRNLRTISKTIDKSGMYTRFYPIGKNDLHITGDYVERNAKTYGVVCKVATDASIETEAELRRWGDEQLRKHAEPTVSIDVEGYELADATGEELDRMTLGRICWIPLTEFGTEIKARIVNLKYQDKIRQPEVFRATLGNNRQDVTKILAEAVKRSGGGGRSAAKKEKEDMAKFEDTNDHVAMVAKGIVGVDAKGNPNWIRLSEIIVDGEGIHQTVKGLKDKQEFESTRIDQNEKEINLEAQRAIKKEGSLEGKIKVTADAVNIVVRKKKGKYEVDAASIVAGINEDAKGGGSYIQMTAKAIDLRGYVTMTDFNAERGRVNNLMTGNTVAIKLNATTMQASQFVFQNTRVSWKLANIPGYGYLNYLG